MTEAKFETSIIPSQSPSKDSSVKLVKILLRNFLSFKEEECEFDPEFTIITGPNGAGKSSIYQAIKFVLGSNNYDGRYRKWADFIHTGKQFASVLLDLSINDKKYQIQRVVFTDQAPKISIQSPSDAQLKPVSVNEFQKFMKSIKIDPDNMFSFMSQGNIDNIKDFKEPMLCSFVEKGIGLNVLREDILTQNQKIDDLSRECSVLLHKKDSLVQKLQTLTPKLHRLENKHKLLQQLQKLQDELLWAQRDEIYQQITQLKTQIESINGELTKLNQDKEDILKQLESKQIQLQQIEKEYQIQKDAIATKSAREKLIENELKKMTDEKNQIAEKIEVLNKEITNCNQQLKACELQIQKSQLQLDQLQQHINDTTSKIGTLQIEERSLITEFQAHQKLILDYKTKNQEIEQKKALLTQNDAIHEELEEEITQKVQEIAKIRHELDKYQWFMKDPRENIMDQLRTKCERMKEDIDTSNEFLKKLDKEYQDELNQMEQIKKSLINKDMPKPKEIVAMMEEVRKRNIPAYGPLIDYISFDESYQKAIESIFGEWVLYSFVVSDRDSFGQLKELAFQFKAKCNIYLEKNEEIRELPIVNGEKSQGIFGYLVHQIEISQNLRPIKKVLYAIAGDTLLVKDHVVGTDYVQKYHFGGKIVTLDGEQIRSRHYVIESRSFIKGFKEKLGNVAQAKQLITTLNEKSEKNREDYNKIRGQLIDFEKMRDILENRLKDIPKLLSQYKQMEIASRTKENKIVKREQNHNKILEIRQSIKQISSDLKELENQLPPEAFEKQSRLQAIPQEIKLHQDKLAQYQTSKENYQQQINSVNTDKVRFETELKYKEKEKTELETELQTQDATFFELFQEHMILKKDIDDLSQKVNQLHADITEIKQQFEADENKKNLVIIQITERQQKIIWIEKQKVESELKLQKIQDHLQKSQLDLVKTRSIPLIEIDLKEIQESLRCYCDVDDSLLLEKQEIEQSIERIIQKRSQMQDEIDAAKKAAKEIETQYYQRFKDSIQNLTKMMNEMFVGINLAAKVRLELIGDIETLGLSIHTIFASQTEYPLHALSGGQRSMVGICLMLSLHKLHPTPFNIYDEIEMFLDPENAQNVARLIHLLAKSGIQFIILMPDKSKTLMQLANLVIGVTRNGKTGPSTIFYGIPPALQGRAS